MIHLWTKYLSNFISWSSKHFASLIGIKYEKSIF